MRSALGDTSQNWTRRFESVITTTKPPERREFRQHQWEGREGLDPAPAHSAAKTPVDANRSKAGLKGEEWLRALSALWKHFPYQQFHSPFALPFGVGFFPSSSLSCNFWSFSYFSWMVWRAEVAFFSCLQNSLKYCRAGANRSRGLTTTSRMREIHIFSISLKKQQIPVLWLSIKGARAPGSPWELHKLNTELPARKNDQPQCLW